MAKLAYLGPEWTFSHDLAISSFPQDEHTPQSSLEAVVQSVSDGPCTIGLIPFYNTTRLSIEESQIALVKYKGKVFVEDVLILEVKHTIGGFCELKDMRELRSKSVVFHQISNWIKTHNYSSVTQKDYVSTSAAIKSLIDEGKPSGCVSVGTASAFKNYKVPVIKSGIQNKPNHTLFFVIGSKMPDVSVCKRVLLCLTNPTPGDKKGVEDVVLQSGCSISSNWEVTLKKKPLKTAYFFEIDGLYSSLGLSSAITKLRKKSCFVLGGYADKCITRLIWPK